MWVECKHIFSNGTEFEIFQWQCEKCTRYRNGKCRILNKCYKAMFDKSEFPYSDLLERDDGFGGKMCKAFTTEKIKRLRHRKVTEGQISIDDYLKLKDK